LNNIKDTQTAPTQK